MWAIGVLSGVRNVVVGAGAKDDRYSELTARHIAELRSLIDDLIVATADQVGEHDLHHRAQAGHGRAHGGADETHFRDRRINHPLWSKLADQTAGGAQRAAPGVREAQMSAARGPGHVLPHHDHRGIAPHLQPQRVVDRLAERQLAGGDLRAHDRSSTYTSASNSSGPGSGLASAKAIASSSRSRLRVSIPSTFVPAIP